jgi:hypothetical protein
MKKLILLAFLINTNLMQAQGVSYEDANFGSIYALTLTKLNTSCDSAVIRVEAHFSMGGPVDDIPFISYNTTSIGDTLIINCHYDDYGIWAAFGGTTTKTITVNTPTVYTIAKVMAYTTSFAYNRSKTLNLCGGTTSIQKNLTHDAFAIYPNPTSGLLNMNLPNFNFASSIRVYNAIGELVSTELLLSTTHGKLDLSQKPNGVYFIRIGSVTKKIIKE